MTAGGPYLPEGKTENTTEEEILQRLKNLEWNSIYISVMVCLTFLIVLWS